MSYTSIINMIDKSKKRTTYQPRKRNIKKTALYDNGLARSFVRLSRCRTSNQCFALAAEAADEFKALEFLHKLSTEEYRERRLRIKNMKAFSLEAASYLYSLEEENKTENWFTKALNFFKEMFKKLIIKVAAIWKGLQVKISFFIASFSNKLYKNFDKSKFVNMGAKIKVTGGYGKMGSGVIDETFLDPTKNKTLKDIFSQVPQIIQMIFGVCSSQMSTFQTKSEEIMRKAQETFAKTQFGGAAPEPDAGAEDGEGFMNIKFDMPDPDELVYDLVKGLQSIKKYGQEMCAIFKVQTDEKLTDPRKIVNQILYSQDEKPKQIETTVGEYLNCRAGETPTALLLLSEPALKTLQAGNKIAVGLINGLKKNIGSLEKILKSFNKRLNKEKMTGLSKFTKIAIQILNTTRGYTTPVILIIQMVTLELLRWRADIAKAIKAGSKGAASESGGSTNAQNQAAPEATTPEA